MLVWFVLPCFLFSLSDENQIYAYHLYKRDYGKLFDNIPYSVDHYFEKTPVYYGDSLHFNKIHPDFMHIAKRSYLISLFFSPEYECYGDYDNPYEPGLEAWIYDEDLARYLLKNCKSDVYFNGHYSAEVKPILDLIRLRIAAMTNDYTDYEKIIKSLSNYDYTLIEEIYRTTEGLTNTFCKTQTRKYMLDSHVSELSN